MYAIRSYYEVAAALGSATLEGVLAAFTLELVGELSGAAEPPQYARSRSGPVLGGDSRGYGAYLGTIPDYREMESETGGVLLAALHTGPETHGAGETGIDPLGDGCSMMPAWAPFPAARCPPAGRSASARRSACNS